MLMSGASSIRDVMAFPEDPERQLPADQAPSEVTEGQLRELHLRVRKPRSRRPAAQADAILDGQIHKATRVGAGVGLHPRRRGAVDGAQPSARLLAVGHRVAAVGESAQAAAACELAEETGLEAGSRLVDLRCGERFAIIPPWREALRADCPTSTASTGSPRTAVAPHHPSQRR